MNIRLKPNGPADKPTSARPAPEKSDLPKTLSAVPQPPKESLQDSLQELKHWPAAGARPEVELCAYRPEDGKQGGGELEMCAYRPAPEGKGQAPEIMQCAYFPENHPSPQIKTPRPSGQEIDSILNKLRPPQG